MFIHPAIFWVGLAAVGLPILIHILNRRRFKVRPWAAMQFLLESLRKNRRRLRVEELLLLALRCLIVLVLTAAVARFTGCSVLQALPGTGGSQSVVFIIDDSASSGQKVGDRTVLSVATADLARQLAALPPAASVAIIRTSEPSTQQAVFGMSAIGKLDDLVNKLNSLAPADGKADYAAALAAAGEFLKDVPGGKRVCILSDFRAADFASAAAGAAGAPSELRQQFASLTSGGVEVVAMDYGRPPRDNATVESLQLLDRFAVARGPKGPSRLAVTVRNNSPQRLSGVQVALAAQFAVEGKMQETRLPVAVVDSIGPGESRRVEFGFVFPQPGPAVLRAELAGDELPADNAATLALDVRPAIRVLVVDGKPDIADPSDSESFFLNMAMDDGQGSYGQRVDVVTVDGLASVPLRDYDLVMLANVPELPLTSGPAADAAGEIACPLRGALESFVSEGGGLVIFCGDRVNPKFYNEQLFAGGRGLSPLLVGQRIGDGQKRDSFFRLDPRSFAADPLMRTFAGEAAGFAGLIRFYAFLPADERASVVALPADGAAAAQARPPRVLARFTDPANSPAIATRQFGQGSVVMFYSTASTAWTDWPRDEVGTFPAMLLDVVDSLARPAPPLTASVGSPLVYWLSSAQADATVTLKLPRYPASELVTLPVARTREGNSVRYEAAREAGTYTMTLALPSGATRDVLLARNTPPAEGDLRPAGQAALAGAFGSEKFTYVDRRETTGSLAAKDEHDYTMLLAALLLALLTLEVFLGQKFGHYA